MIYRNEKYFKLYNGFLIILFLKTTISSAHLNYHQNDNNKNNIHNNNTYMCVCVCARERERMYVCWTINRKCYILYP